MGLMSAKTAFELLIYTAHSHVCPSLTPVSKHDWLADYSPILQPDTVLSMQFLVISWCRMHAAARSGSICSMRVLEGGQDNLSVAG